MIKKINLKEKFHLINDYWHPRIVAELNDQMVKLVKIQGPFIWHKHDNEDEMFLVHKGHFKMELRDHSILLEEGEFVVIPRGVEHRPVAETTCEILLFEPKSTVNTGGATDSKLTKDNLEKI